MADQDYESVLFVSRDVHVYRIPARSSNAGYRAADWGDMGEPLWRGRMRVIEKGSEVPSKAFVRLEDANTGELFANTPYTPSKTNPNGGVEAVLDSSRYFVLTVVDQDTGARAYLGAGFPERTESFDFNVALQDWSKRQAPPAAASASSSSDNKPSPHMPATPRDFSLKPGEVLNIKIGGKGTKKAGGDLLGAGGKAAGGGSFLLPPPPPAPRR